jgi:two-component system nitrogen regulation response regulator GlnG
VRQLQSALKYAVIHAPGDVLMLDCLPEDLREAGPPAATREPSAAAAPPVGLDIAHLTRSLLRAGETDIYRRVSQEMDRVVLETVLGHVKGNQVQASELLGISRTTLRAKLRALGTAADRQFPTDGSGAEE